MIYVVKSRCFMFKRKQKKKNANHTDKCYERKEEKYLCSTMNLCGRIENVMNEILHFYCSFNIKIIIKILFNFVR